MPVVTFGLVVAPQVQNLPELSCYASWSFQKDLEQAWSFPHGGAVVAEDDCRKFTGVL